MFAADARERPHQRHVADDVDHLAVDGRRLVGEIVVQWTPGGGEPEHDEDELPATTIRTAAIGTLTVTPEAIETNVATQGGSTFHMNMLSTV